MAGAWLDYPNFGHWIGLGSGTVRQAPTPMWTGRRAVLGNQLRRQGNGLGEISHWHISILSNNRDWILKTVQEKKRKLFYWLRCSSSRMGIWSRWMLHSTLYSTRQWSTQTIQYFKMLLFSFSTFRMNRRRVYRKCYKRNGIESSRRMRSTRHSSCAPKTKTPKLSVRSPKGQTALGQHN